MPSIYDDYLTGSPAVLPFFAGAPRELLASPPPSAVWDSALVADLRAYQETLGSRTTVRGDEAAVVTGQQAGLFTGPLYTIYKAITAIRLAQELEAKFNRPVVPVFWVHGDDHDFEEVATANLLAKNNRVLSLRYEPTADVRDLPINAVPLEDSLHVLIDEAAQETNGSEQREPVRAFLHESLDASQSFADWMARIVARLFQGTPLVMFSPALPAARAVAAPVFAREVENPTATTHLAREQADRLVQLGYDAQVQKAPEECAFFANVDGRRRKVEFRDGTFVLPETGATYATADMSAWLEAEPGAFSANVLLRGVVQQTLFPTAAYVAGPGEIAYWAQLKPIFERHDRSMPIVYPRARGTLTTLKISRLMAELGVSLDALLGNPDELENRVLRAVANTPEMEYIRHRRTAIEDALVQFAQGLEALDPKAGAMAHALPESVSQKLDHMERVLARQDEGRRATALKRLERVQNTVAPLRRPQERVLNVFSFLFSYGWALVPRMLQEMDVHSFAMQEIEL